MVGCIKNSQCPSGACNKFDNRCKHKAGFTDPCSSTAYCEKGLICDPFLHRCELSEAEVKSSCVVSFECPVGQFCKSSVCVGQLEDGMACTSDDDCKDGLGCHLSKCVERCVVGKFECPTGKTCDGRFCETAAKSTSTTSSKKSSITISITIPIILVFIAIIVGIIICIKRRNRKRNAPPPLFNPPRPPMVYAPPVPIHNTPPNLVYAMPSAPPEQPDTPPPSYEFHNTGMTTSNHNEKQ